MMKRLFALQYVKHVRMVGAIAPSSEFLARKMVAPINFMKAKTIIEFGPGTGSFTKILVGRMRPGTKLLLIEHNQAFYDSLVQQFASEPNVIIAHDTAANLEELLKKHTLPTKVDYIVSGLPFASLSRETSVAILSAVVRHLNAGGVFITFQYTRLMKTLFSRYFPTIVSRREWRNIPPAYVLECRTEPRR